MTIHIDDLKFKCIIGILDFERTTPQDVILSITIEYQFQKDFINYADVVQTVKSSMIDNKFFLIEDALNNLEKILLNKFSLIDNLSIKITKPSILSDCKVSVSSKISSFS